MGIFDKAVSIGKAALKFDTAVLGKADSLLSKALFSGPLGEKALEARNSARGFVNEKLHQGFDHIKTHGKEYLDDPSKLKSDIEGLPGFDKVKNVAHKAWDFIPDGVKTAAAGAVAGPVGAVAVQAVDAADGALSPSNTGAIPQSPEGITH